MVIWNSLISFVIVVGFFIYVRSLPDDTAAYEYGGIAFLAFPFFAIASILSLIALIIWIKKARKKEYKNTFQYLAITPSIPIFLTWIYFSILIAWYLIGN